MCGIAGILSPSDRVDLAEINRMTESLRHRGPDDSGVHLNNQVALGNRRLSIIDLSPLAHQPMFSTDRRFCIVYNGEIYNYQEIREELQKNGCSFESNSDTEVILKSYEEYGPECLQRLRGMFAFAIWDEREKLLFAARDRLGKKPLYYSSSGRYFAFASEIRSLLTLPWVSRELNPLAISEYFALQYIPAPRTAFRSISKLPPAHYLIAREYGRKFEIHRYWQLPQAANDSEPISDPTEKVEDLLQESVRLRLISDAEVGILLSGGIDSSLITAIASRSSSKRIKTFSVGFKHRPLDELPHANQIAKEFGTEHYSIIADEVTPDVLLKIIAHIDEPLGDPACIPTYLIARFAAQHVKVVLSGEGGDEVFGGYPSYVREQLVRPLFLLSLSFRKRFAQSLSVDAFCHASRFSDRLAKVLESSPEASVVRWTNVFGDYDRKRYFSELFLRETEGSNPLESIYDACAESKEGSFLGRGMEVDLRTWLPDDLLMKVDKMTMANSLEARTPFLDHKLVQYMTSLGTSYKVQGKKTKILLKEVASRYLPHEIVNRKKHGFEVPIVRWLLGNFRDMAEENFDEEALRRVHVFNVPGVRREWMRAKVRGSHGSPRKLWLMFCFLQWCRQHNLSL
jgi:asparagine synthase (glutamine-hydrolysing)